MELGVFMPNGKNGFVMSSGSPNYSPTFEHNREIAIEAERQGFNLLLSMMKYRGFGGATGFWNECLETFTLMAGLAAVTSKIELIPTVTLLAHHPAIAARMVATIDDISGGRCGLNIVTGWNKPEYEQMGMWRGEEYFEHRYEYAEEYMSVLKTLWRDGTMSIHSEHFNLTDCHCFPKPRHEIGIVCAGQSPKGMKFTAEHGDRLFAVVPTDKLADVVKKQRDVGKTFGRRVGVNALFHLVMAENDTKARSVADRIIGQADTQAILNMIGSAKLDTNVAGSSSHQVEGLNRPIEQGNAAFMGIPVICGSYERVADTLNEVRETSDVDGVLFSFVDYVADVRAFGERVLPRLKTVGSRQRNGGRNGR